MSLGAKEVICIREMCNRLIKLNKVPIMYEDNSAAVSIAKLEDSPLYKTRGEQGEHSYSLGSY